MTAEKKIKVVEKVFKNHPKYKGGIRWAILNLGDKYYKVEKRRAFGWISFSITKAEYDWIDTPKKAQGMWVFCDMHGTATWFGGELAHPITGVKYQGEGACIPRPVHNG